MCVCLLIILFCRESDQNVLYEKDDIFLLRYRDIRQLLLEKKVKLV